MPEPVKRNQRYMPGLDGLRAIAVLAVIAFHLGFGWAPGGLLGVGIFFTLSGYLITDILLNQLSQRGRIKLGSFWLGRARRLLPALFVMLAIVVFWVTVFGPAQPDQFRKAVVSSVFYVNNWEQIFGNVSYFARFAPEGPLNHLWSLSVEEQFYIFWPFLLLIGVKIVHERPLASGIRPRLALVTVVLALISTIEMAILFHPSLDPSRIYYGTDTRAGGLLFGAALAMVWPSRRLSHRITPQARNMLDGIGVLGLLIIFVMVWRVGEFSSFLYRGGFVVLSLATVMVLMPLAHPACRLGRFVGIRPLRWVGVRSYGIYLWQTPVIVLSALHAQNPQDEGLLRKVLQVAAIFAIAALSWRFVEEPIRHGAIGRFFARRRAVGWGWYTFVPGMRVAIVAAGVLIVVGIAGMAGLNAASAEGEQTRVEQARAAGTDKPVPLTKAQAEDSTRTSCKAVVHIGDSTSEGLDSAEYLPDAKERIEHRYREVGVKEVHMEVQGATSIEERFEGQPNAQEVAEAWKAEGFEGCWVLALGTNEAADVAAGSNVSDSERIQKMMAIIGTEPVLWVNVKSLPSAPEHYEPEGMKAWDEELERACPAYPNMRVYDWAGDVKDAWFIEDGVHFTSPGYAARAQLIAQALAHAFPAKGNSPGAPNVSSADAGVAPRAELPTDHPVDFHDQTETGGPTMADPNERDAKLIQYLQEAFGKEQELEVALQADIAITSKDAYKKRLKQHLKETKAHAKALERRIKKLGGGGTAVQKLVGKATAVAKAPMHMVRGSGEQEKMLKNAKTQYTAEQEEISTYLALETFANKVGDRETANLARTIRREEERMAKFLEGQVRQLAGAVATAEIPARLRRTGGKPKRRSAAKRTAAKPAAKKASAKSKSTGRKSTARKSAKSKPASGKSSARKSPAKSKSTARKSAAKKSPARKSSKAKASKRTAAKRK